MLDECEYASVSELAATRKLNHSFVSRVLRLTLLAPDIVEAVLDGRQVEATQRKDLLHNLPGLPTIAKRSSSSPRRCEISRQSAALTR